MIERRRKDTRRRVPKGSVRCAAVRPPGSNCSPFAVRAPSLGPVERSDPRLGAAGYVLIIAPSVADAGYAITDAGRQALAASGGHVVGNG
jgi:hypothetical protein